MGKYKLPILLSCWITRLVTFIDVGIWLRIHMYRVRNNTLFVLIDTTQHLIGVYY